MLRSYTSITVRTFKFQKNGNAKRDSVIVDMIKSVQPAQRWKVLIVDSLALRIITSVCRMNDILEEDVTLIEDISRKRQPYVKQEAIYFMTPTELSVQSFINDYINAKPYAAAHLFFTSPLSDALFQKIKSSPALQHVKTLKELNVEYLALEQQAFILDMPDTFYNLYNQSLTEKLDQDLQQISRKLVSVVSSLSAYPSIRYYTPPGQHSSSAKLAAYLQNDVDTFVEAEGALDPDNSIIFLIVDRSVDVMTPLLHEFTYQAMMHDLLKFTDTGKYQKMETESDTKKVMATLDEYDAIWVLIRHWHYADAVEYISETFKKFIGNNKAASAAMGGQKNTEGIEGINTMKELLNSLPEFQEMRLKVIRSCGIADIKYSTHINICQECKDMFAKRQLDIVASLEQDLSTGETVDGRKPKNILLTILPLLDDKYIPNSDKIRLLMLYIISQDGIHDSDRRRLLEQSKLSMDESQAITNLNALGVKLTPSDKKDQKSPYSYNSKKAQRSKSSKNSDAMNYDLSRYTPMMKFMVEDLINDRLDSKWFPYTKEESKKLQTQKSAASSTALKGELGGNQYSLRTTRATWVQKASTNGSPTKKEMGKETTSDSKSVEYRRNGPTVVLFVIGGMTYSEMRAVYEVTNEMQRDVIIGSTHVFTPVQFLDALTDVHLGAMRRPELVKNIAGTVEANSDDKKSDRRNAFGVFKKKELK